MIFILSVAALLLHAALMLAAAPLLVGGIRWLKARLLGRTGPPLLQPWRDLLRLARKQPVLAENASLLFRAAPSVSFAAILAAVGLLPSFTLGMAAAPSADLLVFAGLLSLSRCSLALAGLDVGTAFGGVGASRAMTLAAFAEPALIFAIFTLALLAGTTNIDIIASTMRESSLSLRLSLGLVLVSILLVASAENGRIPVGDPATNLELTMLHEATALEYSGRHLALIQWGMALKLLVWLTLIATVFVPMGVATSGANPLSWLVGLLAWAAKLGVLAVELALFETATARMGLFRIPEFLGVAILLGLLAAIFLYFREGSA
jgi:formate hydrogenlyase subunit 4